MRCWADVHLQVAVHVHFLPPGIRTLDPSQTFVMSAVEQSDGDVLISALSSRRQHALGFRQPRDYGRLRPGTVQGPR